MENFECNSNKFPHHQNVARAPIHTGTSDEMFRVYQTLFLSGILTPATLPHSYIFLWTGSTPSSKVVGKTTKLLETLAEKVSAFFQNAAEPLFNSSHVDTAFRMDVVFPACLTSATFMNALLYSIVQTANKGKLTSEGLCLLSKALKCLRQTVASSDSLTHADIGAMMILQGVAASLYSKIAPKTFD